MQKSNDKPSFQTETLNKLYNAIEISSEIFFRLSKKPIDQINEVQRACILVLAALKTLKIFDMFSVALPKPEAVK